MTDKPTNPYIVKIEPNEMSIAAIGRGHFGTPIPQHHETNKEPVVEGFVKRACPYCQSVWYGQKDDYPHMQVKSRSDEQEIAACGLMPLIEDYAIAVHNGDKNSSMVLKKIIEASLEELESQRNQKK